MQRSDTNNNPYSQPMLEKCFRCNQPGHRSNECPTRRTVHMIEWEEGGQEYEDDSGGEDSRELMKGNKGEPMNYVIQRVILALKTEEENQRYSIFKAHCTINNKVCNVIIDSGSCENIVSKALVVALALKTEKHPRPYKIGWIRKGYETHLDNLCRIPFSNGKFYKDEALCDVVEMDVCHVLLE